MLTKAKINNLIDLYISGNLKETESKCRDILSKYPKSAEVLNILGAVLISKKLFDEALDSFILAIEINPNFLEAHNNLGNTFLELRRLEEAIKSYDKALLINPAFVEAQNNRGNALLKFGKLEEAIQNYKKAISINPSFFQAYNNLGNALLKFEKIEEAIENYKKAILINPNFVEAYNNYGSALMKKNLYEQAIINFKKSIDINPNFSNTYYNYGKALNELGLLKEAISFYKKAIKINPFYFKAHSNLLLLYNYIDDFDLDFKFKEACNFGTIVKKTINKIFTNHECAFVTKKLKIGFVSGDFRNHPVGHFLEGVLSKIDSSKLELIAYNTNFRSDELTKRIKKNFSHWIDLFNKSDEEAAKIIFEDKINILIDLSGHTAKNRLRIFAFKPAPIQVSWLGYFATTGLKEIDYLIGDPYVTPLKNNNYFIEKIYEMPDIRMCFTPPSDEIQISELPALHNGYITFGSFNNILKINDNVIVQWSKIINSIENSKIFIKSKQLDKISIKEKMIAKFNFFGIKSERLIIEGQDTRNKYLESYNKIDVALDSFPFTGGTTSIEALWMGVPVLTLVGESFVSRQGLEILMNIGLNDYICYNKKNYVSRALDISQNLNMLSSLRKSLRKKVLSSPLCNDKKFAKDFEKTLLNMWSSYKKN